MKKLTKLIALLLVLAMVLAFSGCGKMTAEKLVAKMAVACVKNPVTQETMDMEFDMSIGAQGFMLSMDVMMTMDMVMSTDPYKAYMDMEMSMSMLGQNYTENMQMYMQEADGTMTAYTYTESTDLWTKQETEVSSKDTTANYDWLKELSADMLSLDEDTQSVAVHEVYVLRCTVTGEQMQQMMSSVSGIQEALGEVGMSGLDMSALTVPMVLYVDTKTYLPVQMEMEMQGMDDMMNGMMDDLLGEAGAALGMEIEVGQIKCVCRDISYDAAVVPEVPQEAIANATTA